MAIGFGIAAIIIVVISIFIPLLGIIGTGLAMLLAAIAALAGDRAFATATALVGAISTFFFSPAIWAAMAAPDSPTGGKTTFFVLVLAFLILPFVAMFLNASGKFMLNQGGSTKQ